MNDKTHTDRELLEMAAKAAGYDARWHPDDPFAIRSMHIGPSWGAWDPLTDDGDALRLAAKLMMSVEISEHEASTYAYAGPVDRKHAMELWRDDPYSATRRAIVRAAAEIGRAMP